jgi:hypothetical protein
VKKNRREYQSGSLISIDLQHSSEQIEAFVGNVGRSSELARQNIGNSFEGKRGCQHRIQNNTEGPHVHLWSKILRAKKLRKKPLDEKTKKKKKGEEEEKARLYHFRGCVCGGSTEGGAHNAVLDKVGKAKIDDFYIEVFVHENVGVFDVTMNDAVVVEALKSADDLF